MNKYYEMGNRTQTNQSYNQEVQSKKKIKENLKDEQAQCRNTSSKLPESLHRIKLEIKFYWTRIFII